MYYEPAPLGQPGYFQTASASDIDGLGGALILLAVVWLMCLFLRSRGH